MRRTPLIVLLATLGVGPASQPTDPTLAKALRDIDAKVAALGDVTADFTQQKFTPLLKKPVVSKGRLIGKGDRTLWATDTPEPTQMAVDIDGIRIFYPRQQVEEIYPLQGQLASLASSPLPRLQTLQKFFRFESLPSNPPGAVAVRLIPTDDALRDHVDHVDVVLNKSTGIIQSATNVDADGNRTVLTFTNVKTNTGALADAVQLHVPAGTKRVKPLEGLGDGPPGGRPGTRP